MRILVPATTLLLAACATTPQAPVPQPVPITPSQHVHSSILGMTASELVAHFGNPALQVREGPGLKMQFRSPHCVLDAYLYTPPAGGVSRVTHSDARLQSGADTDQATCISAVEATRR
jgi:hypothetical protein